MCGVICWFYYYKFDPHKKMQWSWHSSMIVFFKFFNNPNQSRNLLFNKILLNIVKVPCVDLSEIWYHAYFLLNWASVCDLKIFIYLFIFFFRKDGRRGPYSCIPIIPLPDKVKEATIFFSKVISKHVINFERRFWCNVYYSRDYKTKTYFEGDNLTKSR